jgi:cysteinyl-tRNA synthetase
MTDLTLYNTLTRSKERFEPIDRKNVRMYVCGPTVYDHAHIGNARPVIVFDVLYRLLRHFYGEDHVTYVRNITDVDDKIIDRARRDFPDMPLNDAIREVTEKTTAQFQADMKALGCLEPSVEPRATEHIDGMVEMIQTLITKGHAYVAKGKKGREVLFDVTSDDDYGLLSNRKLDEQQPGARVAVESHKKNAGDFVLWKESADDEPGWDGQFDGQTILGRPGWHIECSVMAKAHLGETFDIHGGGLDLIFPHHENEIAQSCCANGTERMSNIWMHNGFLQVEGKKMSKSDGNFITVHDVLHTDKVGGRKWPGEVVRLAILMTHYREPLDFTVRRLEEAEATLQKWGNRLNRIRRRFISEIEGEGRRSDEIVAAILSDLNVTGSLGIIDGYSRKADSGNLDCGLQFIQQMKILGFDTLHWHGTLHATDMKDFDLEHVEKIGQEIELRNAHIANENYPEADRIRDELLAQGIQLKDGKDSETGERITTWEVVR